MTLAAMASLAREPGPKSIVLFTDGEATGNHRSVSDVVETAIQNGVVVHVISLGFDREILQDDKRTEVFRPNAALRILAEGTGGLFLNQGGDRVFRDQSSIEAARWGHLGQPFSYVAQAMHQGYLLTLAVSAGESLHPLRVTVRQPGLTVHAPLFCCDKSAVGVR